eukprot:TRINITY_DN113693_c0_g1_i1.p1 TRINITY_DN113693_c0_g1~~TRINITY_DN113693_c0_g1_i1.p1  ORF type:complete len:507 (-),score=94.48 TRINITY_DN113693_c0_g1_i1:183-1703(-)
MSEYFRRLVVRDPPPAAGIRFRCAKLHRTTVPGSDQSGPAEYNTIYDVMRSRGWKETEDDKTDWSIFWADKDWIHDTFDRMHLDPHQHVNHFRNHYELTRKDLLIKNLKRTKRSLEKEGRMEEAQKYNVCPVTFVVPQEYSMFVEEFKKSSGATWIMKPVGRSQGAGIFLMTKLAQVQQWKPSMNWMPGGKSKDGGNDDDADDKKDGPETYVCQKYVDSPLLIGGKKFDIRLYALCISYHPLIVYMHRGGFARFSLSKYSSDKSDLSNLSQHLTNIAVQKHSKTAAYKRTGAKWDVSRLKRYMLTLTSREVVNRCFTEIESIVIHSLLAVQKVMINDKHCFELYGYDVLIDSEFKPWLLEVNASPSLTANTDKDYEMKFGLLDDMLSILDIEKYMRGDESQIGGFDILYKDGLRYAPPENAEWTSFIGCANNRDKQLRRLAKTRVVESTIAAEAPVKGRSGYPELQVELKNGVDLRGGGRRGEQRVCRVYPIGGGPSDDVKPGRGR